MNSEKALRIAVVVGVFPAVPETFIVNQLSYLKQKGHRVDVLATRYIDNQTTIVINQEIKNLLKTTYVFNKQSFIPKSKFKRLRKALQIFGKAKEKSLLLKACNIFKYGKKAANLECFFKVYYQHFFDINSYDVVHIHFGDNAVHLINQLKNYNGKTLVSFHGYDSHKLSKSFYENLACMKNIDLTVNTNFTKLKVEERGFQNHAISILPVGLDTDYFKPNSKRVKEEAFNIVFIGRFIKLKAPLLAIKIAEQLALNGNKIKLHMIGDGDLFNECRDYISKKNLTESILLLGSKNQDEVRKLLNKAEAFLFPGIIDDQGNSEAQGLVIQEAQAMQVPVIVSNVGGMSEGLIDGKTGFVIQENDVEAFVSKLSFLISNPEARQTMGEEARKFVVNNYDSRILGDTLVKIYQQ